MFNVKKITIIGMLCAIAYVVRNCRKISDADCAGYFFEDVCQKT